jgi:hypothetical protein
MQEAMSCAVLCKQREMKPLPVVMMWAFLCLMTGVVAMATAWVFTNEHVSDESLEFYRIKEVCGAARGLLRWFHAPRHTSPALFQRARERRKLTHPTLLNP